MKWLLWLVVGLRSPQINRTSSFICPDWQIESVKLCELFFSQAFPGKPVSRIEISKSKVWIPHVDNSSESDKGK